MLTFCDTVCFRWKWWCRTNHRTIVINSFWPKKANNIDNIHKLGFRMWFQENQKTPEHFHLYIWRILNQFSGFINSIIKFQQRITDSWIIYSTWIVCLVSKKSTMKTQRFNVNNILFLSHILWFHEGNIYESEFVSITPMKHSMLNILDTSQQNYYIAK